MEITRIHKNITSLNKARVILHKDGRYNLDGCKMHEVLMEYKGIFCEGI